MNEANFEKFKACYQSLVEMGVVESCSDKELFLHYVQAELDAPNMKKYWDDEKVYRYYSGVDDKPEEDVNENKD